MDPNMLMLSFLFGLVGMAMLVYGRKAGRIVPLGVGAALDQQHRRASGPGMLARRRSMDLPQHVTVALQKLKVPIRRAA
jgi:hypothetical protein